MILGDLFVDVDPDFGLGPLQWILSLFSSHIRCTVDVGSEVCGIETLIPCLATNRGKLLLILTDIFNREARSLSSQSAMVCSTAFS